MSEFQAECGCKIHMAQWTSKRKVASVKYCQKHSGEESARLREQLQDAERWKAGLEDTLLKVEKRLQEAEQELVRAGESSLNWNRLVEKLEHENAVMRTALLQISNPNVPHSSAAKAIAEEALHPRKGQFQ